MTLWAFQYPTPGSKKDPETKSFPVCCTITWLHGFYRCPYKEPIKAKNLIIESMIKYDCGYTATYFAALDPPQMRTEIPKILKELGWKKIVDIKGPNELYRAHGDDIAIWVYSMVEHDTYRQCKEKLGLLIEPIKEKPSVSIFAKPI